MTPFESYPALAWAIGIVTLLGLVGGLVYLGQKALVSWRGRQ